MPRSDLLSEERRGTPHAKEGTWKEEWWISKAMSHIARVHGRRAISLIYSSLCARARDRVIVWIRALVNLHRASPRTLTLGPGAKR